MPCLIHLLDQFIDLVLPVAQIATFDKVLELSLVEAARRAVKLERPKEVGSLLEVGANGEDLMDQILHTDHAVLAEVLFDDFVVSQWESLLVDLAITALCSVLASDCRQFLVEWLTVDELTNGLLVRVAIGDEGLND